MPRLCLADVCGSRRASCHLSYVEPVFPGDLGASGNRALLDDSFPMHRLDVYLNDHLAGAMVGAELSRRAAENNRGTSLGDFLEELHREIEEDRQTLQRVMAALGVERSALKPAVGWILEKAGRLRLNGQIRGYSPLSRLVKLEGLVPGVSGKRALWQALCSVFHGDPRLAQFNLAGLIARAEEQLEGIGEQRVAAAPGRPHRASGYGP
jgi:hypothetical protein